jgi:hypothetical protein
MLFIVNQKFREIFLNKLCDGSIFSCNHLSFYINYEIEPGKKRETVF